MTLPHYLSTAPVAAGVNRWPPGYGGRVRDWTRVRGIAAAATLLATATLLAGCDGLDSFTGSQSMRWVGEDLLPKDPVEVADYRAVPLLPDLTARQAMVAFGQDHPTAVSDGLAAGPGWSVTVQQTPYATSVHYAHGCKNLIGDDRATLAAGRAALAAVGGDPDAWSWFVVTDRDGGARAVAEPDIEGHQTWTTGSFAVLVDQDGVCAANGVLMDFEKTGGSTRLDSAYRVFQQARHTDGLAVAGDYREFDQTWTLDRAGALIPLWWFRAADHGIVAVDFGDGLETALDTESSLAQAVRDETSAPH